MHGLTVRRRACIPRASRGCSCAVSLALAAYCTPPSVCTRCSLHDSAQQESSAAPPALPARCSRALQPRAALLSRRHRVCISPSLRQLRPLPQRLRRSAHRVPAPPVARHQASVLAVPDSAGQRLAGSCRQWKRSCVFPIRMTTRNGIHELACRRWKRSCVFPILCCRLSSHTVPYSTGQGYSPLGSSCSAVWQLRQLLEFLT